MNKLEMALFKFIFKVQNRAGFYIDSIYQYFITGILDFRHTLRNLILL